MRRALPFVIFVLAVALTWFAWPRAEHGASRRLRPGDGRPTANGKNEDVSRVSEKLARGDGSAGAAGAAAVAGAFSAEQFPIVAPLNQPGSTIGRDLDTLSQVLDAWRTNFPRDGNPVGENSDITGALAGDNALGLVLIPKNHPAINGRGELCDRWGTPFRFHQLSGHRMEIQSAGPDRKFATADDAIWNPPP